MLRPYHIAALLAIHLNSVDNDAPIFCFTISGTISPVGDGAFWSLTIDAVLISKPNVLTHDRNSLSFSNMKRVIYGRS